MAELNVIWNVKKYGAAGRATLQSPHIISIYTYRIKLISSIMYDIVISTYYTTE